MLNKRKIKEDYQGNNQHKHTPVPNNQTFSILKKEKKKKKDCILNFVFCKHRTATSFKRSQGDKSHFFRMPVFLLFNKNVTV